MEHYKFNFTSISLEQEILADLHQRQLFDNTEGLHFILYNTQQT